MMQDVELPGAVEWLGARYTTILTSAETGGFGSIVDSVSPAGNALRDMFTSATTTLSLF